MQNIVLNAITFWVITRAINRDVLHFCATYITKFDCIYKQILHSYTNTGVYLWLPL